MSVATERNRTRRGMMPHMIRALRPALPALLAACAVANCGAQAPPADADAGVTTLRVTTHIVEVSAVVKDKHGEPQAGLSKDDFILKQDGREEPIHYFSVASDLPLTVALLVDVSGSQRTFISDEWRASDVFFETMLRPQDRAMLVQIDARILQLMGMTGSVASLHLALTQLGQNSESSGATRLNDAVALVASTQLARARGRKAIVLLTDGGDNGSRMTLNQAIEQAQRANAPVYAIQYSAWAGFSRPPGAPAGDPGEALLKKLTESTGGHMYTVAHGSTLKTIYAQIGEELRTQYEIGYTPPPDLAPNSFHKLELHTRDKKLSVQARNGFYVQP